MLVQHLVALWRFIPACAGNTTIMPAPHVPSAVHPRVRGEHMKSLLQRSWSGGSSPRARGTPVRDDDLARADLVHPRVRGEHPRCRVVSIADAGSSPRARGTRLRILLWLLGFRFIPACAGNTISSSASIRSITVHPRVRGEHAFLLWPDCASSGSSPRARGTRSRGSAGKCGFAVHPRVRGEHLQAWR